MNTIRMKITVEGILMYNNRVEINFFLLSALSYRGVFTDMRLGDNHINNNFWIQKDLIS